MTPNLLMGMGLFFQGAKNAPPIETGYNPQFATAPIANWYPGSPRIANSPAPSLDTTVPWAVMPPTSAATPSVPSPLSGPLNLPVPFVAQALFQRLDPRQRWKPGDPPPAPRTHGAEMPRRAVAVGSLLSSLSKSTKYKSIPRSDGTGALL